MAINLAGAGQALDGSLPTIFSEFKLLRDETGVMRSTATTMNLTPHEGATKNVNNYGRVIAFNVADGVDITQAQALADTTTSYTPGEVAVQVILAGSTMRRVQDPDLEGRTSKMLNNAYDLKEDSDGTAQLSSFVPIMGVAGDIIGPGHVTGAAARLGIGARLVARSRTRQSASPSLDRCSRRNSASLRFPPGATARGFSRAIMSRRWPVAARPWRRRPWRSWVRPRT